MLETRLRQLVETIVNMGGERGPSSSWWSCSGVFVNVCGVRHAREGGGVGEGEGITKAILAAPALVTGAQSSVLLQGHTNALGVKPVVAYFA